MINIFVGNGIRQRFVNIVYQELMGRTYVGIVDILCIYYGREKDYYKKFSYSSETGYGELKKAFMLVREALKEKCPGSIEDNGKMGKGRAYRYIGENEDPLAEERQAVKQKNIEDYVTFCKASAGILPSSWFSAYFENTQLLLDINRELKNGIGIIRSSLEQNLENLDLLPVFYKAITNRHVLKFIYRPFGQEAFDITFHPQFLKEYNGRWFVFGDADHAPFKAYNVPLDRILGDVSVADGIEYIPAERGFYQAYFSDIVGVTHEDNAKVENVIIRTKSEYLHGLILTKPLHHSQHEIKPYGEHSDGIYGEVALTLEPNRELRGRILMYGEGLEVIRPQTLREEIVASIEALMRQYKN